MQCAEISSQWIIDLKVCSETMKLIEENMREEFGTIGLQSYFLITTHQKYELLKKNTLTNRTDQNEKRLLLKDTVLKVKMQMTDWER